MKRQAALKLLSLPFDEIISNANEIRRKYIGENIDLCGIINAKSGKCSEDCKFCAQSAHNTSKIDVYPLLSVVYFGSRRRFAGRSADVFGWSATVSGRSEVIFGW